MKKKIKVLIRKEEITLTQPGGYALYFKPLKSFHTLKEIANKFEKETGLRVQKPDYTYIMTVCRDNQRFFTNVPKEKNKFKEYLITIEEA